MEIDYYVYFSKTYFAFNHYLKNEFPKYNDDRARIDEVKNLKSLSKKFKKLLQENIAFFPNLSHMHKILAMDAICNNGEVVNFNRVRINSFFEKILTNDKYNKISYFIKICNDGKIIVNCGRIKLKCKHEDLERELEEKIKSRSQKDRIKSIVNAEFRSYVKDIGKIIVDFENNTSLSDEDFLDLYRGFIEIIYMLRNALFHSEINPNNKETKEAYEKAYFLLRDFVKELS